MIEKKIETKRKLDQLRKILKRMGDVAVAVSGGIDSMVLAAVAQGCVRKVEIYHAVSPAVPTQATKRVEAYAQKFNWNLHVIQTGEFRDRNYLKNPVDRCYFCKINLYRRIAEETTMGIISGTNVDDLSDYRPGLLSAEKMSVRHPYLEAGIEKLMLRSIAKVVGLAELSELPAAPCLASRIETGIEIDSRLLPVINQIELLIGQKLNANIVRCRMRQQGIVIELDEESMRKTGHYQRSLLNKKINQILFNQGYHYSIVFEQYHQGSAFIHEGA